MTDEGFSHRIAPLAWMERATCATTDPDLWFPTKDPRGMTTHQAKRVCHGCPVLMECRAYALAHPQVEGIWGGTTDRERSRMRGHR